MARKGRVHFAGQGRSVAQDGAESGDGGLSAEGALAGGHLVEHDAQGEDVRARVDFLALRLLGRHVGRGSQHASLAGHHFRRHDRGLHVGRFLAQLGQAEVEHFDSSLVIDHEVVGLEVAVENPLRMGRGQSVAEGNGDLEELPQAHPAGWDQGTQGLAFHQLHGEEVPAPVFLDRMHGDDVGMVESGDGARLALEASAALEVRGQALRQELERDLAAQLGVVGTVDFTHAAGPDALLDFVVGQFFLHRRTLRAERRRDKSVSVPRE